MKPTSSVKEVDFHLLDLRYSNTRIKNGKSLLKMQNSINCYAQTDPGLAIVEEDRFVLIDGYLSFAALKANGHDCITVQLVEEEPDSLLTLLAKGDDRQLEAVEQAALIQELYNRFNYSFTSKRGQIYFI